jgi:hypothetical protein
MPLRKRRIRCALPLAALLAWPAGCASTPEPDPRYRPAENVLEVIAVLRRHVPDDTYRFEPGQDFTGRNVYRSSLLRLESLERVHAESLRAAQIEGVIAFGKGRALERLRAFDLAAEEYRLAAELDRELAVEAGRSADLCQALHDTTRLGVDLDDLAAQAGIDSDPSAWPRAPTTYTSCARSSSARTWRGPSTSWPCARSSRTATCAPLPSCSGS